ncbi:MAG TPA: hypothetical protein VE987_09965 [Polyangiaceae bacterium]|nr:hypothetical protein [Polyangiaceae bacterium]
MALAKMKDRARRSCCVCGVSDARALVDIVLAAGPRVTLCGSHAVMLERARVSPGSEPELRVALRERRGRADRRRAGDELGCALIGAFSGGRRGADRRRA